MIIAIESVYGDHLLSGRTLSQNELNVAVKQILENHDEKSFVAAFCARFHYKELPYSDGYAAYQIDLDTHRIIVPSYSFPKQLDGAKVLYFTDRSEFEPVYNLGGEIAHSVCYLAIVKYENDEAYYLFHCDESLDVVADDCFWNIEQCKQYMDCYPVVWHQYKE